MFETLYKYYLKKKYYLEIINNKLTNIFINISWDEVFNIVYILFFLIIIISSICVLLSKNPIHSVFFLIIVFLHVSFLLLLLHVEFLAFLIFIVYLGAIAVLFLFVIMMFNIHILEARDNIIRFIPLVICTILIILEISYITDWIELKGGILSFQDFFYFHKNWYNLLNSKDNIIVISIIYNYYLYNFILASLILLVAMIGAIMLTLNLSTDLKKQVYYIQNRKNLNNSLMFRRSDPFKGDVWQIYLKEEIDYEVWNEEDILKYHYKAPTTEFWDFWYEDNYPVKVKDIKPPVEELPFYLVYLYRRAPIDKLSDYGLSEKFPESLKNKLSDYKQPPIDKLSDYDL